MKSHPVDTLSINHYYYYYSREAPSVASYWSSRRRAAPSPQRREAPSLDPMSCRTREDARKGMRISVRVCLYIYIQRGEDKPKAAVIVRFLLIKGTVGNWEQAVQRLLFQAAVNRWVKQWALSNNDQDQKMCQRQSSIESPLFFSPFCFFFSFLFRVR